MKLKNVYKEINQGKSSWFLETHLGDFKIKGVNPESWIVRVEGDRTFWCTPNTLIKKEEEK